MLLNISTTHHPATDLGYLLHKNPGRWQTFELNFGKAMVFYPEACPERCTVSLQVDVDPIALVRNRKGPSGNGGLLDQYVNDRPYALSSFFSVALNQVFHSALTGQCKERPELPSQAIPLEAHLPVFPARGGERFLRQLFEPLGYDVQATRLALDPRFPEWGESPYFDVRLKHHLPLKDLLGHLYVLIPVLDDDKHYWVGQDEINKLLEVGKSWLAAHPEREQITLRYLNRQRKLTREALAQLCAEDSPDVETAEESQAEAEAALERAISLNEQRIQAVAERLLQSDARRIVDLGCGEGRLLQALMKTGNFDQLLGIDVSCRSLEIASQRLKLDELPHKWKGKVQLLQGSLIYRDDRFKNFDAAAVVEVIEHMDPDRLESFEHALFGSARPGLVIITTPNIEYNQLFPGLAAGRFRHEDHRFEWTRQEFQEWAQQVAQRHEYEVSFSGIGPEDPRLGTPTQMAVFSR